MPRDGAEKIVNDGNRSRALHNPFERRLWAFWGTHPGEVNGPRQWANRKLFEALRSSFCDLGSKPADGSKGSYETARKGCAKVSGYIGS